MTEMNEKEGKEERVELSGSTSFGFIDTFFSFHYCNVCKWLNGVFVQQFSDLYLSEVMGAHKGCRVEAQAPREPYFTREAMTIKYTHAHTLSYSYSFPVPAGYDRVELGAQSQTLHTGILMAERWLDEGDERADWTLMGAWTCPIHLSSLYLMP